MIFVDQQRNWLKSHQVRYRPTKQPLLRILPNSTTLANCNEHYFFSLNPGHPVPLLWQDQPQVLQPDRSEASKFRLRIHA